MSFGEKKKVDPTAKWSVTFMNEMSKSRGTSRTGDTFNKALFSLIKADIKEPSTAVNSADKAPKTARGGANNSVTKIGNTNNTPAPSPEVRADTPGDRRSRGLTRSFSLNEITALLAQPVPEEEIRGPESEQTTGPTPAQTSEPTPNPQNSIPSTADDTRQTATPTTTEQNSTTVSDSGITQSTPDSGTTPSQPTEPVIEAINSTTNDTTNNSADSSATTPNTTNDTCQPADSTPPSTDADPVTRVKVPPLPVSPRSPRAGRHRHTRSVGSSHALIEHVISPRSKNSETPSSPRDQISPRNSPRAKHDTSPREIVNSTGAVVGASATEANNSKDKNSSDKKDKKRALKKRSSKRTRPPSTINANNSTSEESSDSPRSIKTTPNKGRRVSSSVSTGIRRGSVSSDTVPHSPRARTLKHAPKIDSSTIDATTQKLNLDYMDDVLISIKEKLLFPSVKSDFTTEKLEQMPLSWVMQRMPLLRAKRDLAFKHHMHTKQLRAGKVPSPALKKDYLLSNMTRWSSSDINKIRPGPSQSLSLTNTPVKAASNNNLRHVRTGSGPQRRVTSIQLIPASPRDNDPNKETKSSPKSGEEVKK